MTNLPVKIVSREVTVDSVVSTVWEVTATLPGARPTKLVRKSDESTQFGSKSSATTTARNFARTYGFADIQLPEPVAAKVKTTKEAAAKISAKKSKATTTVTIQTQTQTPAN